MAPAEQIQSHMKKRKKLQAEKKALEKELYNQFMSTAEHPGSMAINNEIKHKIDNLNTAIKAINSNIKILKEHT